jgi:hypothetical protein
VKIGVETGSLHGHYHRNDEHEAMYSDVKARIKLSLCLIKEARRHEDV